MNLCPQILSPESYLAWPTFLAGILGWHSWLDFISGANTACRKTSGSPSRWRLAKCWRLAFFAAGCRLLVEFREINLGDRKGWTLSNWNACCLGAVHRCLARWRTRPRLGHWSERVIRRAGLLLGESYFLEIVLGTLKLL